MNNIDPRNSAERDISDMYEDWLGWIKSKSVRAFQKRWRLETPSTLVSATSTWIRRRMEYVEKW